VVDCNTGQNYGGSAEADVGLIAGMLEQSHIQAGEQYMDSGDRRHMASRDDVR
jgi:hypothetical protein